MTRDGSATPRPAIFLLVLLLSLGWGFSWPMMKIALTSFPIWTFRAISCLLAGSCLLLLAWLAKGVLLPRGGAEWRHLTLAALFNVTGWHMLIGYGLPLVPAGHAAVLAYTMPLWVVLIGTGFLGQPLELPSVLALLFGLAGIATLVLPDFATFSQAPLGAALVLGAAVCWAIGTLVQKHHESPLSTLARTGWQLVLGSIPIALLAPVIEGLSIPDVDARAWISAIYITIIALVLCYFLWFKIVSLLPASRASISTLLTPALGVVSGALFLGEDFGSREMVALAFIATALVLVLMPPVRRSAHRAGSSGG